jgi:hypothetical protein
MSIRENVYQVMDLIKPENILVSVFDKSGLDELVNGIIAVNPLARFYSTGGRQEDCRDPRRQRSEDLPFS